MKGLTQAQVASTAGISTETVRRFERADVKVEIPNRAKIATAVGLEFDWGKGEVVAPPHLPPAAFEWAEAQLKERLKAIETMRLARARNKQPENPSDPAESGE